MGEPIEAGTFVNDVYLSNIRLMLEEISINNLEVSLISGGPLLYYYWLRRYLPFTIMERILVVVRCNKHGQHIYQSIFQVVEPCIIRYFDHVDVPNPDMRIGIEYQGDIRWIPNTILPRPI